MAGIINRGNFIKALWPGVKKWWGDEYAQYAVEYDKLFETFKTERAFEETVGTSGLGLARIKPEGSATQYDDAQQGFTSRFTPVAYALGFMITREMMDDDLYNVIGEKRAKFLARSMRHTKEIVGANVYNRAFDGAYVGGDGVSLLNAAHPNVAGGTFSNVLSVASDLSEAALEQAYIEIADLRDDRGLLIALKPDKLVIPRQLKYEVDRILKSTGRVGTDANDINALKEAGDYRSVVMNHYLTDPDAWFIRTTNKDGMKYFERTADEFAADNDFDTDNAKFKAFARYVFGWDDARGLFGSPGA